MKRSVAILGPTPAFVRWAIHRACPLREIEEDNLPDSTFRQLRSLSELSLAIQEERVFEEIAFHPETTDNGETLGFPVNEILDVVGGATHITDSCSQCPANTHAQNRGWVGCFGIATTQDNEIQSNVQQRLDQPELSDAFVNHFRFPQPSWYGIWAARVLKAKQLQTLHKILEPIEFADVSWQQFRQAVYLCLQNQLDLHLDYFPSGHSDGIRWKLDRHCEYCKSPRPDSGIQCQECQRMYVAQSAKKRKVLGIRPYMRLEQILGQATCEALVCRYLRWKETGQVADR